MINEIGREAQKGSDVEAIHFPPSLFSFVFLISCGQMSCSFIDLYSLWTLEPCVTSAAQRAELQDADGSRNMAQAQC